MGKAYQVDDTGGDIGLDVALRRRRAGGDGSEVTGADEEVAVVLQEKRPLAGIDRGLGGLGLDNVFCLGAHCDCCVLRLNTLDLYLVLIIGNR